MLCATYLLNLMTVTVHWFLAKVTRFQSYLSAGGQQWTDGIDPDLTVAVIKYCMESVVQGCVLDNFHF